MELPCGIFVFVFHFIISLNVLHLSLKNNINLPIASGRPTASITTFGLIRIGLNALQSLISVETTEVNLTLLYPRMENVLHLEKSIVPFNVSSNEI